MTGNLKRCLCGENIWRIYEDVYDSVLYPSLRGRRHFELVCVRCNRGIMLRAGAPFNKSDFAKNHISGDDSVPSRTAELVNSQVIKHED